MKRKTILGKIIQAIKSTATVIEEVETILPKPKETTLREPKKRKSNPKNKA